jgi:hypothetical protein
LTVIVAPVGLWARGWRNTADGVRFRECRGQPIGRHAVLVDIDADDLRAELFEKVEQRWKRRVLDDDSVAEVDDDLGDAIERVHRPVDDREVFGRERPVGAQDRVQFGQHRLVEVAARQRLAADLGDHLAEVG